MINMEELFEKFCGALPKTLDIDDKQKRQAFEFLFKISYQFLMRDKN